MDYRVWIYILIAVVLVLILSLYLLMKRFSKEPQPETPATYEKRETPKNPTHSGINLRENLRVI